MGSGGGVRAWGAACSLPGGRDGVWSPGWLSPSAPSKEPEAQHWDTLGFSPSSALCPTQLGMAPSLPWTGWAEDRLPGGRQDGDQE